MKRIITFLICFVTVFNLSYNVNAEALPREVVIGEKTYMEVTDTNELIEMAIQTSQKNGVENKLQISQVLSEKLYSSGKTELSGSTTEIVLLDKDRNRINVSAVQMSDGTLWEVKTAL